MLHGRLITWAWHSQSSSTIDWSIGWRYACSTVCERLKGIIIFANNLLTTPSQYSSPNSLGGPLHQTASKLRNIIHQLVAKLLTNTMLTWYIKTYCQEGSTDHLLNTWNEMARTLHQFVRTKRIAGSAPVWSARLRWTKARWRSCYFGSGQFEQFDDKVQVTSI